MKILRLTLKKKWFDMLVSGEKKEEYREIKQYWINRLCEKHPNSVISGGDLIDKHKGTNYTLKKFDWVIFTNGYGKHKPSIAFKVEDITISTGNTNWGAKEGERYFVIRIKEKIPTDRLIEMQ